MSYSIILHGGAGSWDNDPEEKIDEMKKACQKGMDILEKGGTALDAVEEIVRYMEDQPIFNAGTGSALTIDKEVEMDACIMDGRTHKAGGVVCVQNVKNPISLARKVMEETDHIILASNGAEKFAKVMKMEQVNHITSTRLEEFKEKNKLIEESNLPRLKNLSKLIRKYPGEFFGTVGAVVFDGTSIAAGTSTGGTSLQMRGRVGDSGIPGIGNYADQNCGLSCTGRGEIAILRTSSKNVAENLKFDGNLEVSLKREIDDITNLYGSKKMAIIGLDRKGKPCVAFNTDKFGYVVAKKDEIKCIIENKN